MYYTTSDNINVVLDTSCYLFNIHTEEENVLILEFSTFYFYSILLDILFSVTKEHKHSKHQSCAWQSLIRVSRIIRHQNQHESTEGKAWERGHM